jgi:hypothetical protein
VAGARKFAVDGVGGHGEFALETREAVEKVKKNFQFFDLSFSR